MRTKQPKIRPIRAQGIKDTNNMPPTGTPSWCLSIEALEKLGRDTNNIPSYDRDSDNEEDGDIQNHNTDSNEDENNDDNGLSRKKKNKSHKKRKGEKKHKSKKRRK